MVNYCFYMHNYKGVSIDLMEWPTYEARAAAQLAQYKRIYTVTAPDENAEAMAVCAMADALAYFTAAQNGTGAVASASIGSVSVSYGSPSAVDLSPKGQARELYRCASQYLDIYRGVG
jgi:hypothetical protein